MSDEIKHVLANKRGIELVVGLLVYSGAMCDQCGFGTRVTSKRWAKCKRCGARCARRPMPDTAQLANSESGGPQDGEVTK